MFKIATWNVNSARARLPHILQWLEANNPDILVLQETKSVNEQFPSTDINKLGYHIICSGQKAYNGVAVISQVEAEDVVMDLPDFIDPQRRIIAATIAGIRVLNLYVPNGQSVDSEKYQYKLKWLTQIHHYIEQQLAEHQQLVVLGDFNIAPTDQDVHDPKKWEGSVLVSSAERKALQTLLDLGLQDSFRLFEQGSGHYSWWDYRAGSFRRDHGLRIDLILLSAALEKRCKACIIDKAPRTWERPSDHTVVYVELTL